MGTDPRPIGVFDSGLGGLTVMRAIMDRLPGESLVYFGDTARVPYGPKSPDTVRRFSREIAGFLVGEGVKAIVVACNTATAHAISALRAELPLPVIGVIEPGARAAVAAAGAGRIGVIGTVGTIRSGAYERAIREIAPSATIVSRACPLFVPLVEEGWVDHEATRLVAREYLEPFAGDRIEALVLGCTHYPHMGRAIASAVGSGVRLVDSAVETAAELARRLDAEGLCAPDGSIVRHRFIASDDPRQFLHLGARFLSHPIEHVEIRTFA